MPSYLVHCCRIWCIAAPSEHVVCWLGAIRRASSATTLVTDEVLHPIGKIQPLLIGLNLP